MPDMLGSIAVGMNVNLAEFEAGMKKATETARNGTQLMSAEMKRQSREGAEAWRLIDESIGLHVSRPLTKLITTTFPAFGSALSELLGVGAFGALATAGLEFGEHIGKALEKAQKAIKDFQDSTREVKDTFAAAMASMNDSIAELKLTGLSKELHDIDRSGFDELKKNIDALTAAFEKNAKAAAAAHSWWTKIGAAVGGAWDWLTTSAATEQVEKINDKLAEFKQRFDELNSSSVGQAGSAVAEELAAQQHELATMLEEHSKHTGISEAALQAQRDYISQLQQMSQLVDKEKEKESVQSGQAKFNDLASYRKAWVDFFELQTRLAHEFNAILDSLGSNAPKLFSDRQKEIASQLGPYIHDEATPPQRSPQQNDLENLKRIGTDKDFAVDEASRVLNEAEPLLDRYAAKLAEIQQLNKAGLIGDETFNADKVRLLQEYTEELSKTDEAAIKSEDAVRRLQVQFDKLLEHSTVLGDGISAFFIQLQIQASQNGRVAFDLLNQGIKGVENNLANAVVNGTRNWKKEWQTLAKELETNVFKAAFDKSIAAIFKTIGSELSQKGGVLGSISKAVGGGGAKDPAAGLSTAATQLTEAAARLSAAAGSLSAGGAGVGIPSLGGGGTGDGSGSILEGSPGGFVPFAAGGGDFSPGGSFLVGEEGPEVLSLGAGAGSGRVIPNHRMGGGDIHVHQYFEGSVVAEDLLTRAEASRNAAISEQRAVSTALSAQRETNLRKRAG